MEVEQNVTAMIQPLFSKPKPSKNVTVSARLNSTASNVSSMWNLVSTAAGNIGRWLNNFIPESISLSAGD